MTSLISDGYREQNAALHRSNPKFGSRGDRHAAVVGIYSNLGCRTVLDYGCGKGALRAALPNIDIRGYDPALSDFSAEPERADLVICTDVLEHVEPECLDTVLDHIRRLTIKRAFLSICTRPDGSKALPDGRDPHLIVRPMAWWWDRVEWHFHVDEVSLQRGKDAVFRVRPRHREVTVVLWKWGADEYTAETVNVMAAAVSRNLGMPHRVICITDDPSGIECETMPIWPAIGQVIPPKRLNCYRRLKAFAADAHGWLGERILSLDLDGVIVGDITSLVDVPDDFRIWADPVAATGDADRRTPYNGGMWLLSAGARREVWEDFDPVQSPRAGVAAGYIGSDQAWIGARLGRDEATWGRTDGVCSFRYDVLPAGRLPVDARLVWFHGRAKPWHDEVRRSHPWILEHWR